MAPVDHRKPPTRAARRQAGRPSTPPAPPPRPRRQALSAPAPRKRSHSAIGAAVVAIAVVVAVVAFILTRGSSEDPAADGLRMGSGTDSGAAAPATPSASGPSHTKADRKPPASAKATPKTAKTQPSTPPAVNTGPTSPKFKRGQWIVVLEKYTTDVGMDSEQSAHDTAVALSKAGIPAKAMLVDGQYPGVVNSSWEPVTNSWFVYLGPGKSSEQMLNLCLDPRTQRLHNNPSCPTYEPAANPGN